MKNSKAGIIIISALLLLAVLFIFGNSLKSKEDSGADSGVIARLLEPAFNAVLGEDHGLDVHFLVRKAAHFTEFFVLGMIAFIFCIELDRRFGRKLFGFALFFVLTVAVSDEFIQIYSGRGSSVSDVVIDFCGAATGLIICTLIVFIRSKINKNRKEN